MKNRRVFYIWFLSYISVLLVPIFIISGIYTVTGKMMEEEIGRANMSLLNQVQTVMDTRISEIEALGSQIAFNPRVQIASSVKEQFLPKDQMNLYKVAQDFKVYKTSSSFIDDCFLYLKSTDTVIKSGGHMPSKRLYDFYFEGMGKSYEEWKGEITKRHQGTISPILKKTEIRPLYHALMYLQSIPLENPQSSLATIIITVDESSLIEIVKNVNWLEQGTVLILDQDNQIIMSSREIQLPDSIRYQTLGKRNILEHKTINGEKVAISSIDSQVMPWKYITIIPSSIFWEKAESMSRLIWTGILVCIVLGGIVAYIFTRINYNPISKMVKAFAHKKDFSSKKPYNEYEFIQEAISSTLQEQKEMKSKISQQNRALRVNFLLRLLKGQLQEDFLHKMDFPAYNISFDGGRFGVALFYLESYEDSFELAQFILQNIFEELANKHFRAYTVEMDQMIACIINGKGLEEAEMLEHMDEIIHEAREILEDKFQILTTAAISNIHETLIGISQAYEEAFSAMEYRMILGSGDIIYYKHIQNRKRKYLYSIDMEHKLINNIKIGDFDSAKRLLNEIFKLHYDTGCISIEMGRCLMFDLVSTMIKIIDSSKDQKFLDQLQPVKRMMKIQSLQEMKNEMICILEEVCSYLEKQKEEENQGELGERVKSFILQKYNDKNLNVSMLGEQFNMTPAYLSKLFKAQTGESPLDFINSIRIQEAKELLKKEELSVVQTADLVGYSNCNAFIRVFKKYEGITPGKYKNMS